MIARDADEVPKSSSNQRIAEVGAVAVAGVGERQAWFESPRQRLIQEGDCDLPLLLEHDLFGYADCSASPNVRGPFLGKVQLHTNASARFVGSDVQTRRDLAVVTVLRSPSSGRSVKYQASARRRSGRPMPSVR